jgi:rhodanese-related sulfurtransferase
MRNVVLIDTRTERLYEAGHIEKALAPPVDTAGKFDPVRVDAIRKHDAVVLYCDSSSCGTVYKIARRLKALNLPQIYIYTGGFSEWKTCGLPVEKGNDRT